MSREELVMLLETKGQEHLIDYYDKLDYDGKLRLSSQIASVDWNMIKVNKQKDANQDEMVVTPLEARTIEAIKKNRERYEELGLKAIHDGKIAAVLLAGGQGSRLGFHGPKGAVNIGVTKELYIFEMLFHNTLEVVKKAGVYIPFYIMTSEKNHVETTKFLEQHQYFGYPKEYVMFFTQDMAPCVDLNGQILMEEMDKIATSPNGNGGWFSSMDRSGILADIHRRGVEWLNVFSVDNVLQRICDPVFLGAVLDAGYVCGSKVVKKAAPEERVGVMCQKNGKPSIIEYYEMTEEMLYEKNVAGEYAYNFGVTLNYLFQVKALEEILRADMPIHYAEKKIPYITKDGEKINPEKANGYKFELFILDMIQLLVNCLPFEVVRSNEFAPIKNASGVDSVESARDLLKENGIQL